MVVLYKQKEGWILIITCHFSSQSKPLEEYYRKQKNLLDFQVVGAPRETWQGLLAALRLEHINAVNCSKKLTSGYTLP